VLYDHSDPALLYVFEPADVAGRLGKMVVRIDWRTTIRQADGSREKGALNAIRSGGLVQPRDLQERRPDGERRYEVLEGQIGEGSDREAPGGTPPSP
jgi:hypothetical protein